MPKIFRFLALAFPLLLAATATLPAQPRFSGIAPHLASFNGGNECGIGAVVPFAGRLWWVTYAPHAPRGSDDRLHFMTADGTHGTFAGSIGGTPANRMLHEESGQLFIGPYVIRRDGTVRVIPYETMPGRPTGTARHLTAPASKVYTATMEEGLYEVDVETLAVTTLYSDTHVKAKEREARLPGYHGKGLYSGQGVVIYANNGEYGKAARTRPDVPSGGLAEWNGRATTRGAWRVVRRNQFTDVTGPGGLRGNEDPANDPLWSIGWDHRSLLLMLRSAQTPDSPWHLFRLPKASHAYDGAHGWNTEWPRIRDIGEDDLLMTMHGAFWRFPRTFDVGRTAGIAPRSTYLKVIGDFCRLGDELVFGCDDAARSEFLNTRRAKGKVAGPGQSQSNLWFVPPERLDHLGPALGRGGVFVNDPVRAGAWSDPFLFTGFDRRAVHLTHDAGADVTFTFQTRSDGAVWSELAKVTLTAGGYAFHAFDEDAAGTWIRVSADRDGRATVWFEARNRDERTTESAPLFASLARPEEAATGGLVRAGDASRGLQVLTTKLRDGEHAVTGYRELAPDLTWRNREDPGGETARWMKDRVAIPRGVLRRDGASVLYVDDDGTRWRLPFGTDAHRTGPTAVGETRVSREVVTERDLFRCAGTFYELPARNAGGFARIRPIATSPHVLHDYCSWRGLLVLTGLGPSRDGESDHVLRSADGEAAVWLGAVDDLWRLGKPRGSGGPWRDSPAVAGVPSDPFLMTGFDRKALRLAHDADGVVRIRVEVDITGTGNWCPYRTLPVPENGADHAFPECFAAYWIRFVADRDCRATATLTYE
jgi:hypothetical protein